MPRIVHKELSIPTPVQIEDAVHIYPFADENVKKNRV